MTGTALPWLPPPQDGDVERAVAAFLGQWAEAWFVSAGEVRIKPHPGRGGRDLRWAGAAGAAAGIPQTAFAKLGLALAGGGAEVDNPADQAVLERLGGEALADLGTRLAGMAGEAPLAAQDEPAFANKVLHAAFGNESWGLHVALGAPAQLALRKIAAGQGPRPVLAKLADALAPEPVRIGCYLGSATISANDLAGLGVGDLIAFDRRLTDELPLTVADRIAGQGSAKVARDGGDLVVKIERGPEFKPFQ